VEDLLLLQFVREVSILADRKQPGEVTQRAWDEARSTLDSAASEGSDTRDLPVSPLPSSARSIARSLKRPWHEVLEIAHEPPGEWAKALGAGESEYAYHWLRAEHVAYVLKLAARRLGVSKLTRKQYETERKLMIEENRRYLHGRRLRLPTAHQIRLFTQREIYGASGVGVPSAGTWDRALELAGLASARRLPVLRVQPVQPLPLLDLLDRYCAANGSEPTPRRLWAFADEQKLPYAMMSGKRAWAEVIAVWRKRREADGLPAPRPAEAPTAGENALAGMRLPTKPKKSKATAWSDPEKCLRAITLYLEQIPKGKHANVLDYQGWASQGQRGPSIGALKQHGGWSKMSKIARQRMLRELIGSQNGREPSRAITGRSDQDQR
jgi:hypothetical protein